MPSTLDDPLRPDAGAAIAAWTARVRANRVQVDRVREVPDGDFYAPFAATFRPDPRSTDDLVVAVLEGLVRPDEDVLDIGAGGGRYAVPLARVARSVIAVEPSGAMRDALSAAAVEAGVHNIRVVADRWPSADRAPRADVSLMAHVLYDIEQIGAFLDAAERATRRLCVAVLLEAPPPFAIDELWPAVHGEPRATLPALPEFIALQLARRRLCELRLLARPVARPDRDAFVARARRLLWVREGSEKDRRLLAEVAKLPDAVRSPRVGVLTWRSA